MRVTIVGGTGFIGSHLARHLADRADVRVRVVARSRREPPVPLPEGVEVSVGDVTDKASLDFSETDAVVHLVALSPLFKTPEAAYRRVQEEGTQNVVEAAEEAGVTRLVFNSGLGVSPEASTPYLRTKARAEAIIRASNLAWTILSPSVVFGDGDEFLWFTRRAKQMFAPGLPIAPLPGRGATRFQPIWVGDLVPMLARAALSGEHAGAAYELGGPQVFTLKEITELVFRAENRHVRVVSIPMGLARVGLAVLGIVPGFPFGSDQYKSLEVESVVHENRVADFGRSPSELLTLRTYLGVEELEAADPDRLPEHPA